MNGCAPGLALIERLRSTWKWAFAKSWFTHTKQAQAAYVQMEKHLVKAIINDTSPHLLIILALMLGLFVQSSPN